MAVLEHILAESGSRGESQYKIEERFRQRTGDIITQQMILIDKGGNEDDPSNWRLTWQPQFRADFEEAKDFILLLRTLFGTAAAVSMFGRGTNPFGNAARGFVEDLWFILKGGNIPIPADIRDKISKLSPFWVDMETLADPRNARGRRGSSGRQPDPGTSPTEFPW